MTKKTRKKFTDQEKAKAVSDYLNGARSAKQIAEDLGTDVHNIYHWRAAQDENKRNQRLSGLQSEGIPADVAELLLRKEEEIAAYQKKVAEQAVIIDLLKKLQTSNSFPPVYCKNLTDLKHTAPKDGKSLVLESKKKDGYISSIRDCH